MRIERFPERHGKILVALEQKLKDEFSSECSNYSVCFRDMDVNHNAFREESVTLVLYYNMFTECDCYDGKGSFHEYIERFLKFTDIQSAKLEVQNCESQPCLSTPDYVSEDYSMKKRIRIRSFWNQ